MVSADGCTSRSRGSTMPTQASRAHTIIVNLILMLHLCEFHQDSILLLCAVIVTVCDKLTAHRNTG